MLAFPVHVLVDGPLAGQIFRNYRVLTRGDPTGESLCKRNRRSQMRLDRAGSACPPEEVSRRIRQQPARVGETSTPCQT